MTKKKNVCNDSRLEDYYKKQGLLVEVGDIWVNDDNVCAMDAMIQEEGGYMMDFVENQKGEVCEVHYIKVTND